MTNHVPVPCSEYDAFWDAETAHVPAPCSVPRCRDEASYWIADIAGCDTFYLCDEHNVETDGFYQHIETDGTITNREVAVYACAETCLDCR